MALLRFLSALACVAVAVRAGYVPAASPTYLPTNWMTVNTGTSIANYVANPSGTQIAVTYSGQVSNTNLTLINSQTGVQVATQVFTDGILSVNWVSDSLIAVAFTSSIQGLSSTLSPVWTITTTVVAPVTVIGNGSYLWFNTPGSNNNQVVASSVVELRTGKTMWSSLLVTSTLGSTLICASSLWCGLYIGSVSKFFVINALNGTVVASLAVPLSSLASVTVALGSDSDCVAVDCALSFSTATTLVMVTLQQLTKAWVVKIARQISVGTDLYTAALPIAPFSNNLQQPWLVAMAFGRNITFYSVGDGSVVGSIPTVNSNQADNYVIGMVVVPKSATSMTFIASLAYNTTNPMIPTALAATLTLDVSSGNITVTTSWSSTFLGMSYGFPSPIVAVNSMVFVPLCGSNPSTGCILIDAHTGQTAYTLAFAAANVFVASSFPIVVAGSGLVIRSMQQLASFNTQVTSTVLSSGSGDTNSKIFSITDSFAVAVQNSPTATRITSISNANTVAPIFNQAASLTIPASTFFGVAGDIFFAVSVVGTQSQLYLISASNSSLALIGSAAILIPTVVTGAKGTSSGAIVVWSLTQVLVVNGKSQHTMTLTSNTVVACLADSSRIFILTSADLIAYDLTLTPLWTATAGGGIASTLTLGPDFNGTSTLAHYNNGGNTFWVRDRATGSLYFTWDGPNCVGPITVFRGQYWMTVASQITGALPTSQSYLFRLNLESPALSGYYPLYGVPQTPNYYQFSDLGILAIAGSQNLLVLNLFTGATMWSWGTDIMLSNEAIGIVSLTADSKNVVIFIAHQTNPSVRVVVRNIFTGAEVLAFPATNFYSEQPLPGPNNCNAVLLGSGLDGSVEQYACLPIPSVTVPLTWNSNAALLQPSSEVSFPGSTAAPMTTSTPAPKHDDDNKPGSSSHVVVIAIIIAIVVVGGGATAFFVRRRRNARNNEIGYGIIRDDRSMVNAK